MKLHRNKLLIVLSFVFTLVWLSLTLPLLFSDIIHAPQNPNQASSSASRKPKDEVKPVSFLVFGDSGLGSPEQKALAKLMEKSKFDFIIHTGDVAYSRGTQSEIQTRVLDIYKNLFAKSKFYPSLGNHDIMTNNGQPYLNTWDLPKNSLNPNEAERYYSFEAGNTHFISLDSNLVQSLQDQNSNTDMLDWLRADLTVAVDNKKEWLIVYFHHPPFSSGMNHGENLSVQTKLVPIFEQFQVDLVFSGHEHNYQRTCPINLTKLKQACVSLMEGVVYIVSGGGGAALYDFASPKWYSRLSSKSHHFLKVSVESCQLKIEAHNLKDQIFDQFTLEKCKRNS